MIPITRRPACFPFLRTLIRTTQIMLHDFDPIKMHSEKAPVIPGLTNAFPRQKINF